MVSAFFVLLLAYISQRGLGIRFKKYQPFSWGASWILFFFTKVLCIPRIWCMVEAPHYLNYMIATPIPTLIVNVLSGFFWGTNSTQYSRAIDIIGVSPVTGINLGLSSLSGSFVPMIILGTYPLIRVLMVLLLRQFILLGGVIVLPKMGFAKNGNNEDTKVTKEEGTSSLLITGLIMALTSGIGSVAINTGATAAGYPVVLAMEEGANPTSANPPPWIVISAGGSLANFVCAISELIKNRTYTDYTKPGYVRACFKAVLMSVVWFNMLAIYDEATALLSTLDSVMGWVAFDELTLIIANTWGFLDEEWKEFEKAKYVAIYGNTVITATLVAAGIPSGL